MRVWFLLVSLAILQSTYAQDSVSLTGTAINTTYPDVPNAAPISFAIRSGECTLTVSPPLSGSGTCRVKHYDRSSGRLEIDSDGPPAITWVGNVKGNLASGAYTVDALHQVGSFYLAVLKTEYTAASPHQPVSRVAPRGGCSPAVESSISGEVHGWDGETIFKLDNGQIWQQAEYDYNYFYEFHPDVTIYETTAGCAMKVEGEDETLLVKRLK